MESGHCQSSVSAFAGALPSKGVLEPDGHWQEPASGDNGKAGRRKL